MTIRNKPDGGFRFIGAYELLGVYFAFSAQIIRWYDVRVWFACQEAVARRCVVKKGIPMCYRTEEIQDLVGDAKGKAIRGAIKRLQGAGLLRWSEGAITFAKSPEELSCGDLSQFWMMVEDFGQANRKVPVPRRTIRFIAYRARKVLTAAMLGHLFRCCYFRRGEYSFEGSCAAAWVGRVFGIDERNIKIARKQLASIGWLMPVKSDMWHRQRFGGRWSVNPEWKPQERPRLGGTFPTRTKPLTCGKRSPRISDLGSKRSPLLNLKGNSFRSENQKPALAADPPPGVCKPNSNSTKPPTLKHVVIEDLRETARTIWLFEHAVDEGFVRRCEADRLKVVCAAERALRVGKANPCGFFATLVRRKLWHHVTQDEEERARRKLRRHDFGRTLSPAARFVLDGGPSKELSMDAKLVAAVKRTLARHRPDADPFRALHHERPDWTRERWLRAETELDSGVDAGLTYLSRGAP